ncbi:heavy metal-associated isoprenylated plant protein 6 isoform X2 [Juglans microcarpa x Juglans regia]|uniref:heavy metal-associated isoprenylated plant protein 6 isoform X2 n=1 Tax=Juglans microcarpa x Juglans regia TaxID=2249226 RepID=UPI001B7F39F0|nr:heavy metal-associated isoprenylated plant protein 6 isoform X2 [Juglans microcarpa x Juglans regia]
MGEKVQGEKNEGEKKPADKKDDGKATAVFKMEMHCEGCAKKVRRAVRSLDGVEDVKTDCAANKLTVTGKADPAAIKERLEQKTKKKVELVSPQPKKDGGGDKKPEEKSEKKEEKKEEKKPPKESSVVMKIRLHCEGCIHKIKKIILKFNGVEKAEVDAGKDLVTAKGTMDVKELVAYLKEKLKRNIEVVPPKKDEGGDKKAKEAGGGGDKKEKEAGGGGEKKEKEAGGGGGGDGGKKEEGGGTKVEVSKMEYHGYPYGAPMHYWQEGQSSSYAQSYPMMDVQHHQGYGVVNHAYANQGYANQGSVDHQGYGVVNQGYMVPANHPMYAPQMFSDENPNACSIM